MENSPSNIQKFLRSELSFYATVIASIFTVAAFYFGLTNQINLLSQKSDWRAEQQTETRGEVQDLKLQIIALDKRLSSVEQANSNR